MRRRSGGCPGGLMASRLRLRRLLCVLKHHGLTAAAHQVEGETGVFFDAAYMEHLMRMGSWDKADGYLQHFLPTPERTSPQSMFLVLHLRSAWTLAEVAAGGHTAAEFASTFDGLKGPAASNFRHVLHKMHADQPRLLSTLERDAYSGVPSNASSNSVAPNTEQNAPQLITLDEQQQENEGTCVLQSPEKQDVPEL